MKVLGINAIVHAPLGASTDLLVLGPFVVRRPFATRSAR